MGWFEYYCKSRGVADSSQLWFYVSRFGFTKTRGVDYESGFASWNSEKQHQEFERMGWQGRNYEDL